MSTWGTEPWENDTGSDWFGSLFDACGIAAYVDRTLAGDPVENLEELRAAAFLLRQLGRNYIWPLEHRERQLTLAVDQLRKAVEWCEGNPDESDDWLLDALKSDIAGLEEQL